jgi:hypothetical protein
MTIRIKVIATCLECGSLLDLGTSEFPGSVSPECDVEVPEHECGEIDATEESYNPDVAADALQRLAEWGRKFRSETSGNRGRGSR